MSAAVTRSVITVPLRATGEWRTASADRGINENSKIIGVRAYAAATGAGTPWKYIFRCRKLCNSALGTGGRWPSGLASKCCWSICAAWPWTLKRASRKAQQAAYTQQDDHSTASSKEQPSLRQSDDGNCLAQK
eukprot:CAMPEP_0180748496 /NCGR_PEP_ID=MMETSP1038_2-20121128/30088_1 /TAXON_ID=632150 /ORGANISM="Azadinium spinosum, Strain 3D9" /LENGTH=132 /DNA_ID=CAMNT_0022782135 /DNA_START=273 /DNA_END=671 /DNA_ORIENTATION=-